MYQGLSFLSHFLSDFDFLQPKIAQNFARFSCSMLISNILHIRRNKLHLFLEIL